MVEGGVPWRQVVLPWLVSRAICALIVIGVALVRPRPGFATTFGFANFDAEWYVRIARTGYGYTFGGYSSYPFFPLVPALMRAGRALSIPERVTGVVLSHLLFLVALWGVYRIAQRHTSETAARLGVWALALFPSSLVFSTPYPSALFLAASVWAFILVEDGHDLGASGLAVLAALARPNGVVVALALVVACRSRRRAVVLAGPAILVVLGWLAMLRHWTGDALIFLHAKGAWVEIGFVDLVTGRAVKPSALAHLVLAAVALAAVALAWRRLPPAWLAFVAVYLLPPLAVGVVGLGRYANECFPVFVAAGMVLAGLPGRLRAAGFAASVAGLGLLGTAVAAGRVVP